MGNKSHSLLALKTNLRTDAQRECRTQRSAETLRPALQGRPDVPCLAQDQLPFSYHNPLRYHHELNLGKGRVYTFALYTS